ncbi:putative quinol monooxygenase [Rhodococcus sp. SGAir0479]|uniref:putative quinol monooxygenase n=1 Tax=Rhodococcus sp. SGAir0479 TaxID=2567884 RepID=UPI0010CD3D0E|nr:antibiotic biosynthesis monooxygenase family protein [Rhodococcus sp. SGAir0479]QCQ91583.1 antibiotic biosynthesis monooxygenase [Rhodococcus sp. SGAir0479]
MIIVAGHLTVAAEDRSRYLDSCRDVVAGARSAPGCIDYALGADLVDPGRINVVEMWTTRSALEAFRGDGPDEGLGARILALDVREFECDGP